MKGPKQTKSKVSSRKAIKDGSDSEENSDNEMIDNEIVFECESDGIAITSNSRYWIYILARESWEFIQNNMKKRNLYISAYVKKDIQINDTILFYVKDKGKPSGFVAIGQTSMMMEENKQNIRVYNDKNMNRFITELRVISIFDCMCKVSELDDTIINSNTNIKNSTRFAMTLLRGEGVFNEIVQQQLGLQIVKRLIKIAVEKRTENDATIDGNVSDDINNNEESENSADSDLDRLSTIKIKAKQIANTKIGRTVSVSINVNTESNSDSCNSDNSDNSEDYDINSDDIYDDDDNINTNNDNNSNEEDTDNNEKIITNIPVMMIVCDQLRKILKRQKKKEDKIKMVLKHYKYCSNCDITNNNSHELNLTLERIDGSDIKFIENNCDAALEAYLNMTPYPKKTDKEFIKIHHMTQNLFYVEDILLQYSTKLESLTDVVVPKAKKPVNKTPKSVTKTSMPKTQVNEKVAKVTKAKTKSTSTSTSTSKPKVKITK